ncbi:MAG: hypothetical protein PHV74_05390 [Dehalococcoidia bacterium]|nr:hypothetical protein [Dehalococcoidia bacterium]
MGDDILIISKEQVRALIDRIGQSQKLDACLEEVRRMRDIKLALAWRADRGVGS